MSGYLTASTAEEVPVDPAQALLAAHRSLPYFLGLFISWTLHGASVVLLPQYLFAFRLNPLKERLFIIGLVCLNTVDVGFDLSRVVKVFVVHFGDPTWLVSVHRYFENKLLYFSPVFVVLICQMYLLKRAAIFLRTAGGFAEEWRIVALGLLGAAVGVSACCGFLSQYLFFSYANYIVAAAEVSASSGNLYNITHLVWLLLSLVVMIGIAAILSVELSRTRAWQRRTIRSMREEENVARSDRLFVALRNGCPLIAISIISLILYLTQNKAWTFATGSLLPRVYSITAIVWTATPRPRKGAAAAPEPPDLNWATAAPAEGVQEDSRMWTMFTRSSTAGRSLRKKASALRRVATRRSVQPRKWVVDLEADDTNESDKVNFNPDDEEVEGGPPLPTLDEAESIELQQWRESMRLGRARTSFASAAPVPSAHAAGLRHRTSVPSEAHLQSTAEEGQEWSEVPLEGLTVDPFLVSDGKGLGLTTVKGA